MNTSRKVLHLSLLLAMTVPAMAQTTYDTTRIEHDPPAVETAQQRMLLSQDQLRTQDRLQTQDKLRTGDQDQLQSRDRDRLQTRDKDRLQIRDRDQPASGQKLRQQEKHEYRNMFQYEERDAGQGFGTGGSMNRRMNSFGGGSGAGGGGRR